MAKFSKIITINKIFFTKLNIFYIILIVLLFFPSCYDKTDNIDVLEYKSYLSFTHRTDKETGGIKFIPINTKFGKYKVWTKQIGSNPNKKVLLLHGGPGSTHEIFECFDAYFPQEKIEYIYYDQLESIFSDQPNDRRLWTIERYVDEIEQVRIALNLNENNFILLGHSWGGILALEYALKYQKNLKGLIVCNMMSSIPLYNKYSEEILAKDLKTNFNENALDIIRNKLTSDDYNDLVLNKFYTEHILRKPIENWPDPAIRAFTHLNDKFYIYMQGTSDFGIHGKAYLKNWDVQKYLAQIYVPTLIVAAQYDMMDPKHLEWMSRVIIKGHFLLCPNGSHCPMYDDQTIFFKGVLDFINDLS